MDLSAASSLSRGEIQGAFCLHKLSKKPDALLMAELQRLASLRGIWLPATAEQAASLLFRGVAPDQKSVERW